MKFRNGRFYPAEYFVALEIPASEDRDTVPCAAVGREDGTHRLEFQVLYAYGDLCFAREHAERILADHPTWDAGIYSATTRALVGRIEPKEFYAAD